MSTYLKVLQTLQERPGEVARQLCAKEDSDLARLRETLLRLREANRGPGRPRGRGAVVSLRRPA